MVKLTIVSGFLGAGKTTLLRQLIVQSLAQGERCVVIENEFGSVGLDAALLARTGVPVHELNHGCVCCTLKSTFAETLESILSAPLPDRIFFEPSGIFIPDSLLGVVQAPEFARRCRVASFVTVVDALSFSNCRKKFGSFFERQAEFADILALAKTDALDARALEALQAELCRINPRALQIQAAREGTSRASLETMLDSKNGEAISMQQDSSVAGQKTGATKSSIRFRPVLPNGHGFEMLTSQLPASMDRGELTELLTSLASGRFGNIIRAKGQMRVDNALIDFSLADGSIDIAEPRAIGLKEQLGATDRFGEIVIIGESLGKTGLRALLQSSPS